MDNITSTLVSQLLDKALENTKAEERLAYVEKLFAQLPPEGQQEFLLSLTRVVLESSTSPVVVQKVFNPDFIEPRLVNIYRSTSDDFAPGQICCQALSGFASSGRAGPVDRGHRGRGCPRARVRRRRGSHRHVCRAVRGRGRQLHARSRARAG